MKALFANGLWWAASLPGSAAFGRARRRVEVVQRARLAAILRRSRETRFGKAHGFDSIRSAEEFRVRVPLGGYDEIKADVEDISRGSRDILFPGLPRCLEPTSGSAGEGKLIPYTKELHEEFQAALSPWIFHLFRNHPRLLCGRAYWSISPAAFQHQTTPGGIRVGFEDDTAYLSPAVRALMPWAMAVPPEVSQIQDMDSFRYVTLAFLLRARDLTFVSVWNPTFLTMLLAPLSNWGGRLARDIRTGDLTPDGPLPKPLLSSLLWRFGGPNPERASECEAIFHDARFAEESLYTMMWPRLGLISCWADAAARGPAEELKSLFPGVAIQPKGLLATEGVISIPVSDGRGSTLTVLSHFYEFLPDSEDGSPLFAWELERGTRYAIAISTGGGLYRYRIGDVVEVVGFDHGCPILEFVGRGDQVSDLFGEKVHEAHVAEVLEEAFVGWKPRPSFSLLAPEDSSDRYTLFLAGADPPSEEALRLLEVALDRGLSRNVHYNYCRRLGQLHAAEVCWLDLGGHRASTVYLMEQKRRGIRAGDIKPALLDGQRGWRAILAQRLQQPVFGEPDPETDRTSGGSV